MTIKKVVISKAGIQYAHLKMSEVLALKKTADMNKALVAKMTWDVVNNSNKIWVMAFKKKYVRNRNFMKMSISKGVSWAS